MKELKRIAENEGKSIDEIIIEASLSRIGLDDPETRVEMHLKLCEKYLNEAKELLMKKDHAQASEKAWGAASQIVKALALKRGRELRSHGELWSYVSEIAEETGDVELKRIWGLANLLHQNFYEASIPPNYVELYISDVERFISKIRDLMMGS